LKKRSRNFRHYSVYVIIRVLHQFFLLFPLNLSIELGERLGVFFYYLNRRERSKALKNLNLVYGSSLSNKQKQNIVRELFRHIGRNVGENAHLHKLSVSSLKERIDISGAEHLLGAYDMGNGVIGLTAHMGNWEIMAMYLAKVLKIKFSVVARELSNPWLDQLLNEFRNELGVDVIQKGKSGISLLRTLKRNEGLGILADQDTRGEGIWVNFFSRPAHTQVGVAKLAIATGAKIVPIFIVRNKDLKSHSIFIEPPIAFDLTNNSEADIRRITHLFTQKIEHYVRKYPEQWVWIHNRWRKKPRHNK
jgi:KDO2-lipid IV(A) lauroyltransferase